MKKNLTTVMSILILTGIFSLRAFSQTTEFTYQGQLQSSGSPANGTFDFEFLLFDAVTDGVQNGSTLTRSFIAVTNGIFSVKLDFGSQFPGANRFLEIHVKLNSSGSFTTLYPRQAVTSAPYSVKSLTAGNVTGVVTIANGGTGSSTQNFVDLSSSQSIGGSKSFTGTLSGDVVNAGTQFNLAGNRILSAPAFNLFAGRGSGQANTSGNSNTFVGTDAGFSNTTGGNNSFFGSNTAFNNNTGSNNTVLGSGAGLSPGSLTFATAVGASSFVTSSNTVMLGRAADTVQVPGILNSATQYNIGGARVLSNPGTNNLFAGVGAGGINTSGNFNTFVGAGAGGSNTTGSGNTFLGNGANVSPGNLTNATAIGNGAGVTQSNSLVLGNNANVGIGTTAPGFKLEVDDASNTGLRVATASKGGTVASFGGVGAFEIDAPFSPAGRLRILENGNVGLGEINPSEKLHVGGGGNVRWANSHLTTQQGGSIELGGTNSIAGTGTPFVDFHFNGAIQDFNVRLINNVFGRLTIDAAQTVTTGQLILGAFGNGGVVPTCFDAAATLSICSSSIRYKQNVNPFVSGLSLIKQLRPVSFNWKANNQADMGLIAEEVANVEPLLTITNAKGEIEGVKYDRVGVVLVNAVNEQQVQIEAQQQQIETQQKQINAQNEIIKKQRADLDALKSLVCSQTPLATACKPQN